MIKLLEDIIMSSVIVGTIAMLLVPTITAGSRRAVCGLVAAFFYAVTIVSSTVKLLIVDRTWLGVIVLLSAMYLLALFVRAELRALAARRAIRRGEES